MPIDIEQLRREHGIPGLNHEKLITDPVPKVVKVGAKLAGRGIVGLLKLGAAASIQAAVSKVVVEDIKPSNAPQLPDGRGSEQGGGLTPNLAKLLLAQLVDQNSDSAE